MQVKDTFIVTRCTASRMFHCDIRVTSHIGVTIPSLIQMFVRYSRRSDVSIGHCSSAGDKCVYNVSALPAFAEFDATRWSAAGRVVVLLPIGKGFYKGRYITVYIYIYIYIQYAVLQTAVNIVYWLLPPIS